MPKRIALGLTLLREVDAIVALRWLELLRASPFLGPIYAGKSAYTVQARNIVIEQAMAGRKDWDALLWWDADQLPPMMMPKHHDWPGGYFTDYVATLEEPMIGGLYFSREDQFDPVTGKEPHQPVAYMKGDKFAQDGGYRYLSLEEMIPKLRERGKYKIDGIGTGSLLMQKETVEALIDLKGPAVFETPKVPESVNQALTYTEDLYMCWEWTEKLGGEIWLDAAMESGHRGDVWIHSAHYLAARKIIPGRVPEKPREVYRVPLLGPNGEPVPLKYGR